MDSNGLVDLIRGSQRRARARARKEFSMGKNAFDYERQSIPLSHRNAPDYEHEHEHELT